MARPEIFSSAALVCIRATGQTTLQKGSDRRAVIDVVVDNGGCMTLGDIDAHFHRAMKSRIMALRRCGWLELTAVDEGEDS